MDGQKITFKVPAIPVAQPRQRHRIITSGGRSFASNYTPGKHPVQDYKASVRMAASQAYQGAPLPGPLRMNIVFVFPRTNGQIWKKKPMPRIYHSKRPDRDNIEKSTLDALKGFLFIDDCQVCCGEVQKVIAAGDEQPHVEITVEELSLTCNEHPNS